MSDFLPALQEQIDFYAARGRGRVAVAPDEYHLGGYVRLRDKVAVTSRGALFRFPDHAPNVVAAPDWLWVDPAASPSGMRPCSAEGLTAGPGGPSGVNRAGAYFAWEHATGDWDLPATGLRFKVSVKYAAGDGYLASYGGSLVAAEEPPPWGAALVVLRVSGGRLYLGTRTATAAGPTLSAGEWLDIDAAVGPDGTPAVAVNGTPYPMTSGTPVPLPAKRFYHRFFVGGLAGRYPAATTEYGVTAVVRWADWHNVYNVARADFAAADGPFVPVSSGPDPAGAVPVRVTADSQGPQRWEFSGFEVWSPGGMNLWANNTQGWLVRRVTATGRVCFFAEKNCYSARLEDLTAEASAGAVRLLNNAGQFPVRNVNAGNGAVALSANNCNALDVQGLWVAYCAPGGVPLHVHAPGTSGRVGGVVCYDETNANPLALAALTGGGGRLALADSYLERRSAGAAVIQEPTLAVVREGVVTEVAPLP